MPLDSKTDSASKTGSAPAFSPEESFARQLDAQDPLARYREQFHVPQHRDGSPLLYFCGNSLGLQPKTTRGILEQELKDWAELAVEGHFRGQRPWYPYHEFVREPGARLVGGLPHEVVHMNGLTVNLHLMFVTFYRPTRDRYKILMEDCGFPSDTYAVRSQIRWHGLEPRDALLTIKPRAGEHTLRMEDIEKILEREGPQIAVVLLPGIQYVTGQVFDMARLTAAAQRYGCIIGFDLAHAAGNIPLNLHDWNVDFAVWCTYKYLNCGPGAVAGCFVHERHAKNTDLPRFGGWWGNDPQTRFRMHLEPEFVPVPSADAWQISNPPIFSLAPLVASLAIFDEIGMPALRAKSERLTGYLQEWLDRAPSARYEIITPRDSAARGCQLSLLVHERPKELLKALEEDGVICDFREPNIIRVSPTPLYNTFYEVWRFAQLLKKHV